MPDLAAIKPEVAQKAKLIWVNYPNNPTAAVATGEFYQNLIDWAHKYDVAVISDNPYSEVCFENYRAPSFLQFDGAKEVGIEFNSLSKAYNACGWRTGMMLGNKDIIAGMAKIKSHSDRGMFYPLQVAATEALNGPTDFMAERNRMYQKRRDVVVKGLLDMGLDLQIPQATFYVWADIPKSFKDSKEFCFKVLDEISVWMIPGSMYGECGEGFFRIALTHPAERLAEAMERLGKFLSE
jgi:LL-diaminopimelate aminotransferase